jgi:TonB-linked SusC/RagA family outer membrane protein
MKFLRPLVLGFLALTAVPALAAAQEAATITGRVTSDAGVGLGGASVFVEGLNVGATSNDLGAYTFTVPGGMVRGQTVTVTARRIGYSASSARVVLSPGTITQNFTLVLNPLRLGEVVVTGSGLATTVERLGNVRNAVDSSLIQRSNEVNIVNALAGKAPNVEVTSQSGEPGASSYIRIRGGRSFNNSGQPLIVVDGQPIDNTTVSTTASQASTVAPNRASDINPNDIENVEILKGAAAAAIYGARAGQGVILITTKSGRAGQTRYSLRSTVSTDEVNTDYPLQRRFAHGSGGLTPIQYRVNGVGSFQCTSPNCTLTGNSFGPEIPAGVPTYNHFKELFRTGTTFNNSLSVSGGSDRTLFYISGERLDQEGIIVGPNNWYERSSARVKASHRLADRLNVGGNVAFVDSRGQFVQKGSNLSGLLLGALRTPPEFDNRQYIDPATGLHRAFRFPTPGPTSHTFSRVYDNPYFVVNEFDNSSQVGRTYGNVSVDYEPLDWLRAQYTLGADYYADERLEGLPLTTGGSGGAGSVTRADFTNLIIDHNLLATATRTFSENFGGSLSLGQNLGSRRFRQFWATGTGLIAPRPFQLDNIITGNISSDEFESLIHTQSYFGQVTADLWNQLFLTGALRNDGFSTFGASKRRHWFPKASVAWNFTEQFTNMFIPTGKLRFAYGEAGQEPPVYATLSGLTSGSFIDGWVSNGLSPSQASQGGLATSLLMPQPNLGPERTREYEAGFDVGLFRNLSDLSFTWYNSRSRDVILFLPVSPAGTGYTLQANNAAVISNKGIEVTLNVRPFTGDNVGWEVGMNYGRNRNRVLDLAGAEYIDVQNGAGTFTGIVGTAFQGSALPVMRGQDFARCGRGVVTFDFTDIDAACGNAPPGALYIGPDGFPVEDPTNRIIADPNPDWTGSVRTAMTFRRNLQLSALVDIRHGGEIWNGTKGALYNFGAHRDTEFRNEKATFGTNYMPACPGCSGVVAGPGVGREVTIGQGWYQGLGSGFGAVSRQFVEDAGYIKLREISVSYTFSNPLFFRGLGLSAMDLRIAGRNLRTWTDYTGLDPETNLAGAEVANRGIDYFNNPQTRSIVFSIGLSR